MQSHDILHNGMVKPLGIHENATLQDINNIKNIITSKFKKKMWRNKYLESKKKLRYYKEVSNP